ncbi:glutamate racemase [bacterium]|nr:glutamate racemase [bacterium]
MNNQSPIGIFDSGIGGLTVLKSLMQKMPKETYIYFGDTAHVPYGNKSKEVVIKYSLKICNFLVAKKVKLIIVACNTSSSLAITILKTKLSIPIIDVINPMKFYIQSNKHLNKIGIIGTHNTISSNAYNQVILSVNDKITIYSTACPLFVPIIEEGLENHEIAYIMVKKYLEPLIRQNIQILILGCTHYPIIKNTIMKTIPNNIYIIDSAENTANYVLNYLQKNDMLAETIIKELVCYVSDESRHFEQFAKEYLQLPNLRLKTIQI